MLHGANRMTGFSIIATDGDLGSVDTLYFDDDQWTVRYLVVDTGRWLTGRKVLISPLSVRSIGWNEMTVRLDLSRRQIESCPDIDTDKPVSRQYEAAFHDHFGYPYYWTGPFVWGATAFPESPAANPMQDPDVRRDADLFQKREDDADPHLRSCKEMAGYAIQATDDTIGHVDDFLFDEKNWAIQLIVVDPREWWPGKHVMISPKRIERIDWVEQKVFVTLTRDEVKNSPEYDEDNPPLPQMGHELYRGGSDRPGMR